MRKGPRDRIRGSASHSGERRVGIALPAFASPEFEVRVALCSWGFVRGGGPVKQLEDG